jgi:hypothetical protein
VVNAARRGRSAINIGSRALTRRVEATHPAKTDRRQAFTVCGRRCDEDDDRPFSPTSRGHWWCGVDVGVLYTYITAQLETPREGYDEHISKSSLSCETKVYRTSRRKNQTSKG